MLFDQTFKNLNRVREILAVLLKYGFEDFVVTTPLQKLLPPSGRQQWKRDEKSVFDYSRWERVRMVCEELGPTFIKGAQLLSNRPDLLPDALINEFAKLQNNVPPFEFKIIEKIIKQETGKAINELFSQFNRHPIGSASIGQVHRARLLNGENVVVKVQRPKVRSRMETDLVIIKEIVKRTKNYFARNDIPNPMDAVLAFEKNMYKELDYSLEARNMQLFNRTYADDTRFYSPKVYRDASTEKVLVSEYVKGCKITDVAQLKEWGLNPITIAETGIEIYLTQIFEYGIFHADPHPGNILVRPDGIICLIDFGMMGRLMRKDKYAFAGVLIGMAQQNARQMAVNLRKLALSDEVDDLRKLEYDLNEIIEDFAMLEVSESNIAHLMTRLQKVLYTYKMRVPGGVFIILRALAILEGIGKTVHPHLNAADFVRPYGKKMLQEQFAPKNVVLDMLASTSDFLSFLESFPNEVKDILKQIRKGELHVKYEPIAYQPILQRLDALANRLLLALVMSSLIIGSSLMLGTTSANLPHILGLPYPSFIGFVLALMLGIILFFQSLRN